MNNIRPEEISSLIQQEIERYGNKVEWYCYDSRNAPSNVGGIT